MKGNWEHMGKFGDILIQREPQTWEMQCRDLVKAVYKKGRTVLDVGCAVGKYYGVLRELDVDINYTGIDKTEIYIDKAWNNVLTKYSSLKAKNISFYNLDIETIDTTEDNPFDIVISFNLLLHLNAYENALRNILNLTKKYCFIRSLFWIKTLPEVRVVRDELVDDDHRSKVEFPYIVWNVNEVTDFIHSQGNFLVEVIEDNVNIDLANPTFWKILKIERMDIKED